MSREPDPAPRSPVLFPQVLILLFGAIFLGGRGGTVSLEDRVRDAIEDPARAEDAARIARGIQQAHADRI